MTDDRTRDDADGRLDARLRLAGERWRAAEVAAATPTADDLDVGISPGRSTEAGRRRRFVTIAAAAAVVAALGVAVPLTLRGGDNPSAASAAPLRDTVWRLVAVGDADPDARSTATLSISTSGALTADDECALIGASVSNTETSIDVTRQIVRYKSCTDQYGVRLSGAVDVLKGEQPYSISADDLTIGTGAQALHFTAMPADFPAPTLDTPTFIGATWKLISAEEDGVAEQVHGDLPLTISDGLIYTTNTGCFPLTGSVHGVGSMPVFGKPAPLTEVQQTMSCPAGPTDAVRAVLSGRVQQTVVGNKLTITKPGVGTLVYRWVPRDAASTAANALLVKQWNLVSVGGATVGSPLELYIGGQGKSWSAQNGCGFIGGTPTVSAGSVSFGRVGGSNCSGSGKDLSEQIRSGFATAALFRVEGDTLTLYGDTGQAGGLVYVHVSASGAPTPSTDPSVATTSSPPPLVGTTWTLDPTSVHGDLGADKPATAQLRLAIDGDGSFATNGCDQRSGGAIVRGHRIAFEQSGGSACSLAEGYSALDDEALAAMVDGTVTWSISDGRLHLTKGPTTLVFDPS